MTGEIVQTHTRKSGLIKGSFDETMKWAPVRHKLLFALTLQEPLKFDSDRNDYLVIAADFFLTFGLTIQIGSYEKISGTRESSGDGPYSGL